MTPDMRDKKTVLEHDDEDWPTKYYDDMVTKVKSEKN